MTRAGRGRAALLVAVAGTCGGLGTLGCRPRQPAAAPPAPGTPALAFSEPIVELRAAIGQRRTREVRVTGAAAARARLAIEKVEDAALQAQVLPAEGALPAGVRLAFTGDRAGTRTGQVVVTTGIAQAPRLTLLYALAVPTQIAVTPSNPYFNLRDPAARQRLLRVRGARPGFRVLDARVIDGPFVATLLSDGGPGDATPAGEATVRVTVDAGAVSGDQRGLLGKLRLRTNDPAQPEVDVPLFALGALPRAQAPSPPAGSNGPGG